MTEEFNSVPVKEILVTASPLIKSVVDTLITPKLENLKRRFNIDYNTHHVITAQHFDEYFHRAYKRLSIVNTLVFRNSQIFLKDIYIPLTLTKDGFSKEKYKIDSYPYLLLKNYDKVLITDNAGMGKSTIMKTIFLQTIDLNIGVPILIELRRLSRHKTLIQEIQEQINPLEKSFDSNLLLSLINEGGFVFLLDGYDEVSLSEREFVTADIHSFVTKAGNNSFVLTSRPESALSSFGDFQAFRIEPLIRKEAYELLNKYDKKGNISGLLIQKLEDEDMRSIYEFLTNPLLVSLLFMAFSHKQTIPFKKHIFYRQVYDANFEDHDLTKGDSYSHDKYSKLEIDDFHRVLRHIGFSCLKNNQRIEFSKDEVLHLITNARKYCVGLNFSDSDFLTDILSTVPLFSKDGIYYKWAHKSLQEYFAAQFIYLDSKEQQSKILKQMYNNISPDKFTNVLDLYCDIDPKTFRNTILLDLLRKFKNHNETFFSRKNPKIATKTIQERIELCFLRRPFFFHAGTDRGTIQNIDHARLNEMAARLKNVSGPVRPADGKRLICLISYDDKEELARMIAKKFPSLFTFYRRPNSDPKYSIDYSLLLPPFTEYLLNDDIEDQFNSQQNFELVNQIIANTMSDYFLINTEYALSFLNEMESQMSLEKDGDFLLDGI